MRRGHAAVHGQRLVHSLHGNPRLAVVGSKDRQLTVLLRQGNTFCPYSTGCADACLTCPEHTTPDLDNGRAQCVSGLCLPCPTGGYCASQGIVSKCLPGTYNTGLGYLDNSACKSCGAGLYSPCANVM